MNSVFVVILCLSPFFQPSRQRAFVPLHIKIDLLDPVGLVFACRFVVFIQNISIRSIGLDLFSVRRGDKHGHTVVCAVEDAAVGQFQLLARLGFVDILRARADFVPDDHMQVTREVLIRAGDDHIFIFVFCPRRIGRFFQLDSALSVIAQRRVFRCSCRVARLPEIRSAHGLFTRGFALFGLDFQFIILCEHETARDRVDKVLNRRAVVKIHTINRRRTAYVVYGQRGFALPCFQNNRKRHIFWYFLPNLF